MKKKLILLGLILPFLLLLSCWQPPEYVYYVVSEEGETPPHYLQEQDTWCGAACLEMYGDFKYPLTGRSQSEIMGLADINPHDDWLNQEEISSYMNVYLEWEKFGYYDSPHSIFLADLKQLIRANEPFICYVGGKHWILVVGYRRPWDDPYSDPTGVVYADPYKICDNKNCYGIYYDLSTSYFFSITGSRVVYVGMVFTPKAPSKEMFAETDSNSYPPTDVYANYYNYRLQKKCPGPDENDIPFADGSNGIPNPLTGRIIRAADSLVGSYGAEQMAGFDPAFADQFGDAIPYSVEMVTNMFYLRFGDPEDFPCPINCGGQDFYVVTYVHRSAYYPVGAVRVKLESDSATFTGGGIAGFKISGTAATNQGQVSQANKIASPTGFITRKELHELYPGSTFFPFWDFNEWTPTPIIPFWYV